MLWEEFESRLKVAYSVFDKHQGSKFQSDDSRLRMLNNKTKGDFLEMFSNGITIDIKNTPMTITYSFEIANNINVPNGKLTGGETNKIQSNINVTNISWGRGVRGGHGLELGRGQ